tara:strand:+ start:236 stop:1789 length:1554 start_codon:yes stop_codon:yes gene_type:complete
MSLELLPQESSPNSSDLEPMYPMKQIIINSRFLRDIVADSRSALASSRSGLYRHGGVIVELSGDAESPQILQVSKTSLTKHMDKNADYVRHSKDGGLEPARPPLDVVSQIFDDQDVEFPELLSVSTVPLLNEDTGAFNFEQGYDPGLRVFYAPPPGVVIEPLPEKVEKEHVAKALALLSDELLGDFPFEDPADRTNAIALFLLPFVRHLIHRHGGAWEPTPLHFIVSPTPGTGKGLLAQCLTASDPQGVAVVPFTTDNSDTRKMLTAKLRSAPRSILLDNVSRLRSDAMAAVLTADHGWSDRVLNTSKMITMDVTSIFIATGNNPDLSADIIRRTVPIRIDAEIANPELRTDFKHSNLLNWIEDNRGSLIWAGLILIKGWNDDGRRRGDQKFGSFQQYCDVMGGILDYAGLPGFLGDREALFGRSVSGIDIPSLLPQWHKTYNSTPITASKVFALAQSENLIDSKLQPSSNHLANLGLGLKKISEHPAGKFKIESQSRSKTTKYKLTVEEGGNDKPD